MSDNKEESTARPTTGIQTEESLPNSAVEIDALIQWHYDQISILKAKRNALAPIRRLPNELMTRIITIYASESDLFKLRWTNIMFVCQHWHALILAAQPLWAYIDLGLSEGNLSLTRLFAQIKRSGVAPLTIKTTLFEEFYIDCILDNSARIQELVVDGLAKCVFALVAKLPESSLPILASLSLNASGSDDDVPDDLGRSLPETLLEGRLPNLRELNLECVTLPWSLVSGLTVMSLTQCPNSSSSQTFPDLLDMLRSCPDLHILKLELVCPTPNPDDSYAVVDLPALNWLQLRDPADVCEALLKHLRIPSHTAIHLLPDGLRTASDIRDILIPLRKHTRAPGAPTPVMLKIDRPPAYCMLSFLKTTTLPAPLDDSDNKTDVTLSLNCHPSSEAMLPQMLTQILNAVPCEGITHLYGRMGYNAGVETWRSLLALVPSIDHIYLRLNTGAVNCIEALRAQLAEAAAADNPHSRASRHIRLLHIQVFRMDAGDTTLVDLLTALEGYLDELRRRRDAVSNDAFEGPEWNLEFDDARYVLAGPHEERLKRFFALMKGDILWNREIYDPVERQKQLERIEADRQALFAEYNIEI
ncbi:F-box domain-containing protein [Favolaschia claudopus]|uniref:F-box domain-containing protein n=1 Tax=Favolaschia claudopus TaxID=2862362 RepID=A0AAW0AZ21_9AGAR